MVNLLQLLIRITTVSPSNSHLLNYQNNNFIYRLCLYLLRHIVLEKENLKHYFPLDI